VTRRDADAVPCPGCGRRYDRTRFQGGRTLHCTCGARVGPAPAPRARSGGPPRFAVDAMLGRLAVWLRLLGFDAFYEPHVEDAALARRALEEGRALLTRDRALPEAFRLPDVHVVAAQEVRAQLREVAARYGLARFARPFSRCSLCNAPLEPVAPEAARAHVPPRVATAAAAFLRCPACGRLYWEGSHVARMRRVAEEVLGAAPGAEGGGR